MHGPVLVITHPRHILCGLGGQYFNDIRAVHNRLGLLRSITEVFS